MAEATAQGTPSWQTPEYTEQENIYNQQQAQEQQGLLGQQQYTKDTYANQRQQTINSYQQALDQINYGMRQVGIQTRAGSASRGLYDASGNLSGIGQNVSAQAIEPLTRQATSLATSQATTMQGLALDEQNALANINNALSALPTKYNQVKLDLRNQIISQLQEAKNRQDDIAREKENFKLEQESSGRQYLGSMKAVQEAKNAGKTVIKIGKDYYTEAPDVEAKTPGTRAYQLAQRSEQESAGREYLSNPQSVANARKAGRTVFKLGNDFYALSTEEEAALKKKVSDLNSDSGAATGYKVKRNYDRVSGTYSGLTFLNKAGEPVSPLEYAQANNKSLIDVLSGSGDPGDQAFIDAYNMEMEGVQNGKTTEEKALANLQANFGHIFGVTSTPQKPKSNLMDILSKYNR